MVAIDTILVLKIGLIVSSIINILLAIVMIALTSVLVNEMNSVNFGEFGTYSINLSIFGIILALLLIGFSVISIYASLKQHICLLTTVAVSLGILFIFELGAATASFVLYGKWPSIIRDMLLTSLNQYNMTSNQSMFIDYIQNELQCCGFTGPEDWKRNNSTAQYPSSCCANDDDGTAGCGIGSNISSVNKKGCYMVAEDYGSVMILTFSGISVVLIVLSVIELLLAAFLSHCPVKEYSTIR